MVAIFWLITLANYFGERWSSAISTFGVVAGTLVPAVVIIGLVEKQLTWSFAANSAQMLP
jgi:amino acid transporter